MEGLDLEAFNMRCRLNNAAEKELTLARRAFEWLEKARRFCSAGRLFMRAYDIALLTPDSHTAETYHRRGAACLRLAKFYASLDKF